MKLDMGEAWNSATAMIGANRDVLLILAGVFFFLPYLTLTLLVPEAAQNAQAAQPDASMEELVATMTAVYAENWWAFLLVSIMGGIGMLAVFVLLTDKTRPTVGEALKRGAVGLVPYLVSQLLVGLSIVMVVGIPIALAAASGSTAILALLGIAGAVVAAYLVVKFSLSAAVIGIEGILNPVQVLQRSWKLTKGNSLRLFGFFFLLLIALGIVAVVVTLVLGVIFAAVGGQVELIGNAVVGSLVNAVFAVIVYSVLAAVHRQLAGPSAEAVSDTFE